MADETDEHSQPNGSERLATSYLETFSFSDSDGDANPRRYLVQNRTPKTIRVRRPDIGEFILSPFGERLVRGARLQPFEAGLRRLRERRRVRVRPYRSEQRRNSLENIVIWCGMLGVLGAFAYALFVVGTARHAGVAAVALISVLAISAVLTHSYLAERVRREHEETLDHLEGDVDHSDGGTLFTGNETARQAWNSVSLVTVIMAGAVLPALAIFVATDMKDFFIFEDRVRVKSGFESGTTSRLIQIVYTAVLALFPALMYFQFDRLRVGTIRKQWLRNIFRLDPRVRTLTDVQATYGDQLNEASNHSVDTVRLLGGKRSPIVIATVLIALGWTLLVLRTSSFDFSSETEAGSSADIATEAAAVAKDAAARASASEDPAVDAQAAAEAVQANQLAQQANKDVETIVEGGDDADAGLERADDLVRQTNDEIDQLVEQGSMTDSESSETQPITPEDGGGDVDQQTGPSVAPTTRPADPSRSSGTETSTDANATPRSDDTTADEPGGPSNSSELDRVAAAAAAEAAGAARSADSKHEQVQGSTDFFQLLNPNPTPAAMAFLGGYFFAVFLILRGYFRGDLRPKVYNQITARLVLVVAAAYVINALWVPDHLSHKVLLATSFLAGVIPTKVLRDVLDTPGRLRVLAHNAWHTRRGKGAPDPQNAAATEAFGTDRPLTHIDGLDLHERERLVMEGVGDIEALAHSDLVSNMVNTRLPIERLIDWTDQAVLILLLDSPDGETLDERISRLRALGIRTATGLLSVIDDDIVRHASIGDREGHRACLPDDTREAAET